MPSKLQTYMQMADEAQRQITGSYRGWTGFLTTAARLYKYPYAEQVMIHAQRPDATACAEYDFWNEKMGRYVRRGSKGIALIDSSGERPRLRYVFDVSDTGGREFPKSRYLWEYREEHADAVSAMLESRYGVDGKGGLPDQLERIASQLAEEYWRDYKRDILAIVDDSFLYGYDEFNVGAAFQSAAAVSIAYSLMSRCGLEADDRFEHEDFLSIFDFNTPEAAAELGTAVSRINGEVLRQIEVTIKNYEREKIAERSESHERTDLHPQRGLSDSRPEPDRAAASPAGQVRQDAEELPEGASSGAVEQPAAVREAVPPSAGDRRGSEQPTGTDDAGADEVSGRDGSAESQRPDEVGRADEHAESAGRGNDPHGTGVQLNMFDAPAGAQMSFFPSEAEQIQSIAEAESVTPSAFSMFISQDDIDHILRAGGNADAARMKIAAEFSKQKPLEEQFMYETFETPRYLRGQIEISYVPYTAEWQVSRKSMVRYNDVAAFTTYGTDRASAYRLLEDALNLRDIRIYDTIEDADGRERRVLNAKETTLAAQKQQLIRDAFKDWIWKDPERRETLVRQYNEEMNSTRPREYDGSHIVFSGMNPEITLREHQKNAIAHVLYGGNTLLAHEVGAGKSATRS